MTEKLHVEKVWRKIEENRKYKMAFRNEEGRMEKAKSGKRSGTRKINKKK